MKLSSDAKNVLKIIKIMLPHYKEQYGKGRDHTDIIKYTEYYIPRESYKDNDKKYFIEIFWNSTKEDIKMTDDKNKKICAKNGTKFIPFSSNDIIKQTKKIHKFIKRHFNGINALNTVFHKNDNIQYKNKKSLSYFDGDWRIPGDSKNYSSGLCGLIIAKQTIDQLFNNNIIKIEEKEGRKDIILDSGFFIYSELKNKIDWKFLLGLIVTGLIPTIISIIALLK